MLTDQKIVVIGGSSGMGLATAKYFASQGAHIVIASRSQDKLKAALSQIKGKADAKPLDFTCEESTRLQHHTVQWHEGQPSFSAKPFKIFFPKGW
jgi:NAD(P)-dependent dehydrogenase (short-subunit alcohol dehydrogenase family)